MAKEDKEKKLVLEQLADQEGNPVLFEGNPLLITHPNPKNPLFYQAFRASTTPVDGHWLVEALSGYGDPNLTIQQGTDIQGRIVGVTSGIERLPIKIHYSALQHLKEKYPGAEIEDRTPYAQSQPSCIHPLEACIRLREPISPIPGAPKHPCIRLNP